jgi:hypothetical protein
MKPITEGLIYLGVILFYTGIYALLTLLVLM